MPRIVTEIAAFKVKTGDRNQNLVGFGFQFGDCEQKDKTVAKPQGFRRNLADRDSRPRLRSNTQDYKQCPEMVTLWRFLSPCFILFHPLLLAFLFTSKAAFPDPVHMPAE